MQIIYSDEYTNRSVRNIGKYNIGDIVTFDTVEPNRTITILLITNVSDVEDKKYIETFDLTTRKKFEGCYELTKSIKIFHNAALYCDSNSVGIF